MNEPQDKYTPEEQKVAVPKVKKGIYLMYKNLQSEIYQYLEGKDLLHMERVCKWTSQAAKQDFLWRYLAQNSLTIMNMKYKGDNWKKHFWRNYGAKVYMTPQRFNYVMCPIRHFQEIVKLVDCFENFIFAADEKGHFTIFLINENDMENDEDTLTSESFVHGTGIEYLKHQMRDGVLELILVNGQGEVYTYEIENPDAGVFQVTKVSSIQLPFQQLPSNLYVCPLNDKATQIFVSNYPLDGHDFMQDTSVFIFDTVSKKIIYGNKLLIEIDPSNAALQEAVYGMSRNNFQIQGQVQLAWQRIVRPVDQNVTLQSVKADRGKQRLAVFDGSKLTISLFNKKLAIVDINMPKMEQFLKKTNTVLFQDESQVDLPVAMDLRLHKGVLLVNHLIALKMFDYKNFQLTDSEDLQLGLSPLTFSSIGVSKDEFTLVRKLYTQMEFTQYKIDVANKRFIKPAQRTLEEEKHRIQDMELQNNMLISATSEGGVKFRRLGGEEFKNPFFINAGSKTMKSYKDHPTKPGVSLVKATQNKIIVVLGNLIRAYSFDFKTK